MLLSFLFDSVEESISSLYCLLSFLLLIIMYMMIDVVIYVDVVMVAVLKLVMGNVSMHVYAIMLKELLDMNCDM
jgi:hypothetical protein